MVCHLGCVNAINLSQQDIIELLDSVIGILDEDKESKAQVSFSAVFLSMPHSGNETYAMNE